MIAWTVSHEFSPEERDQVHRWIAQESYWAEGLPRPMFDRSLEGSLCFALRADDGILRGFARVITDRATFAYLCDVFVDSRLRGKGGARALMDAVMAHPDLQNLRRWLLATRDAHGLYARYGFTPIPQPERLMQRHDSEVYARLAKSSA